MTVCTVRIKGQAYRVTESLGYQPDRGVYAKMVIDEAGRHRIVTSYSSRGPWRWTKPSVLVGGPVTGQ